MTVRSECQLIGGFIVSGDQPKRIIIRAIGPSLDPSGVGSVLADPTLELHGPTGALLANSATGAATAQITVTVQTTGTYTVIVGSAGSGFNDGTGSYLLTLAR